MRSRLTFARVPRALPAVLLVLFVAALACGGEREVIVTVVVPQEVRVTVIVTEEVVVEPTPVPAPTPEAVPEFPAAFVDVTEDAGVGFQHHEHPNEMMEVGGSAVVLDFNGDGLDDIYAVDSFGVNALYRNEGDGAFTDVAAAGGVDDPESRGSGGCAADYDNDGDQDLFVTNYGASKLFRNDGGSAFADVTADANVGDPDETHRSAGCAWGDYDQDGFLDLIVVRYVHEWHPLMMVMGEFYPGARRLALFHSNGDGTFTDLVGLLGPNEKPRDRSQFGPTWGAGFQPGWVDVDNDGDLDLYVVNDFGPNMNGNVLWHNEGPGDDGAWRFDNVSFESGADVPMNGMALAVGDYNLDGHLDMFMTNIGGNVLLRNDGDGLGFTNMAPEAGATMGFIDHKPRVTWGAAFLDYDNDGDEDLYVVSGYLSFSPRPIEEQPNSLLRNERDDTFTDVSHGSGADDVDRGRGGVYLDFDNDGCLDLFVVNYGQRATLYRNLCDSGNTWLVVDPEGTAGNRDGIGTRITVVTGGLSQIREVRAGSGQMGQNAMAPHFGLGTASRVDLVVVRWPSGEVQTLADVAANQRLVVKEPG